jgi:hypothetical protein
MDVSMEATFLSKYLLTVRKIIEIEKDSSVLTGYSSAESTTSLYFNMHYLERKVVEAITRFFVMLLHHATDLRFIEGGFLLGDAGYALSKHVLTPYRGVRYHLKEFHNSALGRPRNKEELFNLRHASFRNQVERAFGVMKKRFRILREPLVLDSTTNISKTLYTCVALHNFIRIENKALDLNIEAEVTNDEAIRFVRNYDSLTDDENAEATSWRDAIATDMWEAYLETHDEVQEV